MKHAIRGLVGLSCLALMHTASAGAMGPVSTVAPSITPFLSAELAGSWMSMQTLTFISDTRLGEVPGNVIGSWGGRVAAGMNIPYKNHFSFTAETGWNYLGNGSSSQTGAANNTFSGTLEGADLLVGLAYHHNKMEYFGKAGTMVQRIVYSIGTTRFALGIFRNDTDLNASLRGALIDVLPEIKVGAAYNFNDAWSLSLSYMRVFGNDIDFEVAHVAGNGDNDIIDMQTVTRGTTINSVMLGLRYNFV